MADRYVHVDLDLDLRGEEIAGRASADGGPERSFAGWLGLIAALDALVEPVPPPEGSALDAPR